MKFSCPKCKSKIEIQKTFNKKTHVSCGKCGIEDLLEFSKNIDEVFFEFISRFDQGLVTEKGLSVLCFLIMIFYLILSQSKKFL